MEQTSYSSDDTPQHLDSQATEMETDLKKLRMKMKEYEEYVEELCNDYPMTYHKLKQFIKRGNCWCDRTKKPISATFFNTSTPGMSTANGPISPPCRCTEPGALCLCEHHQDICKCIKDS